MNSTTRKTPLGQLLARNKLGSEICFRLIEDLEQVPTNGSGTPGRFDAELLFDRDDEYQGREDLTGDEEPCVIEVADYSRLSVMAWKGCYGRARIKMVEVTEEGDTRRKPVGEILSVQQIGPILSATLDADMGTGGTATVSVSIAGHQRDVEVTDRLSYIWDGRYLRDGWTIRFVWNHDARAFELLDSPICPSQ